MRPSKTNDPTIVVAFCELALKKGRLEMRRKKEREEKGRGEENKAKVA